MENRDQVQEFHVNIEEESSAVDALCKATGFSRSLIKDVMFKGSVWLTRGKSTSRLRRAKRILKPEDTLHLYYDPKVLAKEPLGCELISDEQGYSIWYKPYGIYSQGTKWGDLCTVCRWSEINLKPQRPAFTVHRLDRAASGLIIISHKKSITRAFTEIFENRKIRKIYHAVVHGKFPSENKIIKIDSEINGRRALTNVRGMKYIKEKERTLVEAEIETGRKHQIRRHLSESGFPIVGERLYSDREDPEDLQLSAHYISFICPVEHKYKQFTLPDKLAILSV